jgi:predicted phosphoribosyltransferase
MLADRRQAGRLLARELARYRGQPDAIVLGLARGGVPVAYEVAQALGAPLDVFVVRKLGFPGHEEYAMGAIASGGVRVMNADVADMGIAQSAIDTATAREAKEIERREHLYRGDRPAPDLRDRIAILVDDGLATGSTMRAAVKAVRARNPRRIVVAVPVATAATCEALRVDADEVVCMLTPDPLRAVGLWYRDFDQTDDEEVRALLSASATSRDETLPR